MVAAGDVELPEPLVPDPPEPEEPPVPDAPEPDEPPPVELDPDAPAGAVVVVLVVVVLVVLGVVVVGVVVVGGGVVGVVVVDFVVVVVGTVLVRDTNSGVTEPELVSALAAVVELEADSALLSWSSAAIRFWSAWSSAS